MIYMLLLGLRGMFVYGFVACTRRRRASFSLRDVVVPKWV